MPAQSTTALGTYRLTVDTLPSLPILLSTEANVAQNGVPQIVFCPSLLGPKIMCVNTYVWEIPAPYPSLGVCNEHFGLLEPRRSPVVQTGLIFFN